MIEPLSTPAEPKPVAQEITQKPEKPPTNLNSLLAKLPSGDFDVHISENYQNSNQPLVLYCGPEIESERLSALKGKFGNENVVIGLEQRAEFSTIVDDFHDDNLSGASVITGEIAKFPEESAETVIILNPKDNGRDIGTAINRVKKGGQIFIASDGLNIDESVVTGLLRSKGFTGIKSISRDKMNQRLGGALDKGDFSSDLYYKFGIFAER